MLRLNKPREKGGNGVKMKLYYEASKEMSQVDLTPSKRGYLRMLLFIISESSNKADVEWCKNEIMKMRGDDE